MGETYICLKRKLESLGYNNVLPVDAVPLVECVLADLLQTTRSLQHYMDLSKEVLQQRDTLMLEVEPYKRDNANLIQENNQLHREIMQAKEESLKIAKDSKRKIKALTEDIIKKETRLTKLQHEVRELSLRGICANTHSSCCKSRRKDCGDEGSKSPKQNILIEREIMALTEQIQTLQEQNNAYNDEIMFLKNQVDNRDNEIVRLNMMLQGGRPLNIVKTNKPSDSSLLKRVQEMEYINESFKKQMSCNLDKQHEAMQRALLLADKNKCLQDELHNVEELALKLEEECNKRLNTVLNEMKCLQTRLDEVTRVNIQMEKQLLQNKNGETNNLIQERDMLQSKVKELTNLNDHLENKIIALSRTNKEYYESIIANFENTKQSMKCPTKSDLHEMLETERKRHEKHLVNIENKLADTLDLFNNHLLKYNDREKKQDSLYNTSFVRDLQSKLCGSEQNCLMLRKEIDELKLKLAKIDFNNTQNYKDIIKQLNEENAELTKENIDLSQQLSHYKNIETFKDHEKINIEKKSENIIQTLRKENNGLKNKLLSQDCDNTQCKDIIKQLNEENVELSKENIYLSQQLNHYRNTNGSKDTGRDKYLKEEIKQLKAELQAITSDTNLLRKDKQEYNLKYKDAMDLVEKYKRDLALKQKEIEQLHEENSSYKMTQRNGKASVEHLREECNFLQQQIKRMQSEVIKEKTMSSQIKNIQIETERSSNEIQNELLCLQKKLSLSQEDTKALEKKNRDLQTEMLSLQNDKSNLIDNIKRVDQERDKLVLELDHKAEAYSLLEHKYNSQMHEISKLEQQITDLKKLLSLSKIEEHKLADSLSQQKFLNGEVLRLTQQLENAIIENKKLQSNLTDTMGEFKIVNIEYSKSKKQVEELRQQLQHYVAEIRRIEELLSHKEAERSDMLEHFASLSVEANILENTNHSLESESASKSAQLQNYVIKIQDLESRLLDRDNKIFSQSALIDELTFKINHLEKEVKLLSEEKNVLGQNVTHLKQLCNTYKVDQKTIENSTSELMLYENKIRSLTNDKAEVVRQNEELNTKLKSIEKLLSQTRQEVIELKLALQDATLETQTLKECVSNLRNSERQIQVHEMHETRTSEHYRIPLVMDELPQDEHDESSTHQEEHFQKTFSKYFSSTL